MTKVQSQTVQFKSELDNDAASSLAQHLGAAPSKMPGMAPASPNRMTPQEAARLDKETREKLKKERLEQERAAKKEKQDEAKRQQKQERKSITIARQGRPQNGFKCSPKTSTISTPQKLACVPLTCRQASRQNGTKSSTSIWPS